VSVNNALLDRIVGDEVLCHITGWRIVMRKRAAAPEV